MAKHTKVADPETKPAAFQRPRIEVLERRLQSPHGAPQPRIDLREPGWDTRWFNAAIASDKIWAAKEKGWTGVLPAELADPDQIGGFSVSPDGFVVRGEKGQELLMKFPSDWRRQIMERKAQENIEAMKHQKSDVANAAGQALGSQAGEFLSKNVNLVGDVETNLERMQRDRDEAD